MENKRITNPALAFQYCEKIAHSIHESVLRNTALEILEEQESALLGVKGSDWQHHNYAGGLIVHMCNVTLNAIRLGEFYEHRINMDLLKFCSLMHDIGKIFDYVFQKSYPHAHAASINQRLLGHGFEGANYISNKLKIAYASDDIDVSEDYVSDVITQVSHCIAAHMDDAKQQMFEVLIIGCADKVDAYLEQVILDEDEDAMTLGTGEIFVKGCVEVMEVLPVGNILRDDLH